MDEVRLVSYYQHRRKMIYFACSTTKREPYASLQAAAQRCDMLESAWVENDAKAVVYGAKPGAPEALYWPCHACGQKAPVPSSATPLAVECPRCGSDSILSRATTTVVATLIHNNTTLKEGPA